MPWYRRPTEYICNICGGHFFNRVGFMPADSPAVVLGPGGGRTWCSACAGNRQRQLRFGGHLGIHLGITITYRIHGVGNFTFLGGAILVNAVDGQNTMSVMAATGALGRMVHPIYPGGVIRAPGAFTGPNPGNAALMAWPGQAGMGQHHVHVGGGGNRRVMFGWRFQAYPQPNIIWVQSLTLYIGS